MHIFMYVSRCFEIAMNSGAAIMQLKEQLLPLTSQDHFSETTAVPGPQ